MEFGPLQLLVVVFKDPHFTGGVLTELHRLREHDIVRLIDMLVVRKNEHGALTTLEMSDLSAEERHQFGMVVGSLVGFGAEGDKGVEKGAEAGAAIIGDGIFDDEERWAIADAVPVGAAAAIALLEHRWAMPLRTAIGEAGGTAVTDAWIHPADFVATGAALAAQHQQKSFGQGGDR
ncbi:hypothetical protein FXF51_03300 [Nonomuraea sp. PA05]|uniref:hypothetical protein n=1 Tax=Nonomuraea sp. PA05 TaxID=2604466 RepID=UPI0011D93337|nr:hypothetical protein [Nonomuraea sp. PA05]TYB70121.1 hypothetical protein FXF51_03300 [Nonomuraea sp. PA05]